MPHKKFGLLLYGAIPICSNKEKLVLVTAAIGKTQPAEKSFTLFLLFSPFEVVLANSKIMLIHEVKRHFET